MTFLQKKKKFVTKLLAILPADWFDDHIQHATITRFIQNSISMGAKLPQLIPEPEELPRQERTKIKETVLRMGAIISIIGDPVLKNNLYQHFDILQ